MSSLVSTIVSDRMSRWLLILCTVLLLVLSLEVSGRLGGPSAAGQGEGAATMDAGLDIQEDSLHFPSAGAFRDVFRRPLFDPDRRPAVSAQGVAVDQSVELMKKRWRLSGVIISSQHIAMITNLQNSESLELREGQELEGWVLTRVAPEFVLLENNGRQLRLALHGDFELPASETPRVKKVWRPR